MYYCKLIFLFSIIVKLIEGNKYLLPNVLIPQTYKLKIMTTLEEGGSDDFTFEGLVKMDVMCVNETSQFTLHAKSLEIDDDYKKIKHLTSGKSIQILSTELDPEYDFLHFNVVEPLHVSELYRIEIKFKGNLTTELSGYYLSSYIENDVKNWLAVTKFEPTSARRVFPCFDEPAYKATFKISIGHHRTLSAISNMPKITTKPLSDFKPEYILDVFQETVPMSTYLVAFVVSDFHFKTLIIDKHTFRVWSRGNALKQVNFARETGPKALTFYENYFDIPYPLPKVDMIAIPDFAAGAMENWGLITFREGYLLYDPKISSNRLQYKIASVICHELAHSWFGNLVTMKWWNDLWLNEGFATYMATVCVDSLFPNSGYRRLHSLADINVIFREDSLYSTLPLSAEVHNPKKIYELFGGIAYKKGATLIRMMEKSLGEEVLRAGVISYLKKHGYQNAEQDDLWKSLTEVSHEAGAIPNDWTIKQIMDTWSLQVGYPIVTVTRNYKTGIVSLTQQRYVRIQEAEHLDKSQVEQCWWIPLTYTTSNEQNNKRTLPKLWLTCPHNTKTITFNSSEEWMIFNNALAGLYKVNYDERNWNLLINHLLTKNIKDINEINRLHLLENIMEFAELGLVNYTLAFDMMEYLEREEKYNPWRMGLNCLSRVALLLKTSSSAHIMEGYMKGLLKKLYQKYGGADATKASAFKKLAYIKACEFNVQECQDDVSKIFKSFMETEDENLVHPDLRSIIYCTGLNMGGAKEWDFFWNKYNTSNVVAEQVMLLKVLGCAKQRSILEKYLNMILDENSGIRKQNGYLVFKSVAKNERGFELAKSFLYKNGTDILKLLLPRGNKFAKFLFAVAEQMTQKVELEEFKNFVDKNPEFHEYVAIGIKQALEMIELNIHWYNKNFDNVIYTLRKRSSNISP